MVKCRRVQKYPRGSPKNNFLRPACRSTQQTWIPSTSGLFSATQRNKKIARRQQILRVFSYELKTSLQARWFFDIVCRQLENYELRLGWKMKLWARLSAPQDLWILWIYKVQPQDVLEPWILGSRVQLQDFVSLVLCGWAAASCCRLNQYISILSSCLAFACSSFSNLLFSS